MRYHKSEDKKQYIFHLHDVWWGAISVDKITEDELQRTTPRDMIINYTFEEDADNNEIIFKEKTESPKLSWTFIREFYGRPKWKIKVMNSKRGKAYIFKMGNRWKGHVQVKDIAKTQLQKMLIDDLFNQYDYWLSRDYIMFINPADEE